jgi:predicted nucleic acid-binding protein
MRFWDSSALVAAVVEEKRTGRIRALGSEDEECVAWILAEIEIASALWRRRRAGELTEDARETAQRKSDLVLANAAIVNDVSAVVHRARRLLATHNLRSADALQLAAALLACDDEPARLPFVTLDDRLAEAATREGFTVVP